MEEPELRDLWARGDREAKAYYDKIAPHIEEWAKKRSVDLLDKLKRYFIVETAAAVVIMGVMLWWLSPASPAFVTILVVLIFATVVAIVWYSRIARKMGRLQSLPTVESIGGRKEILGTFIRHLRRFNYTVTPLTMAYGLWSSAQEDGHGSSMEELGKMFLIMLPIAALLIWVMDRFYIQKLYVPILRGYEEIYDRLMDPETDTE